MWSADCCRTELRGVYSQILEVATGEGDVSNDLDLALASLGDDNVVTKVADTALNLDAVVQELLEGGDVEDLVASGLRSVDDELYSSVSGLSAADVLSMQKLTLWVTFWALRPRAYWGGNNELAYCSIVLRAPVAVSVDIDLATKSPDRFFNIRCSTRCMCPPRHGRWEGTAKRFTEYSTYSNGSHFE